MEQKRWLEQAGDLDRQDPLAGFRGEFCIPIDESGRQQAYFAGNSLGLQPRQTARFVEEELEKWGTLGVRGHFSGPYPWMPYHEFLTGPMARLVGAHDDEVVMMNSLTVNLHLMLATFYRPQGRKRKILIEGHAFPSDHFAVESQIRWRGFSPGEDLVVLAPPGESGCFSMDELCGRIAELRDELALALLPGVQYYTGQVFDIERLTEVARANDVVIGLDLAHAAGNLPLHLHDWGPDFAVWCSYKYLNSGPGSVGGCFVARRHASNPALPRLEGWWGHDKQSRFRMENRFAAMPTAEGWQVSNPPILSLAAIRASLDVFERAGGMQRLVGKSTAMGSFLVALLEDQLAGRVRVLTPAPRGCQLSLQMIQPGLDGRQVKMALDHSGFETDWREPDVIRVAPVPLYNRFSEVAEFVFRLKAIADGQHV